MPRIQERLQLGWRAGAYASRSAWATSSGFDKATSTNHRSPTSKEVGHGLDKEMGHGPEHVTPVYFIPPYEWFNRDQVAWAREMGVCLFNFTPGIGSNRDYIPESQRRFAPSREIYDGILKFESTDPHGLNGALLLLHVGAARKDKMYLLLEPLMRELSGKGYRFLRVDEMLKR